MQELYDTPFMQTLKELARARFRSTGDESSRRLGEPARPFTEQEAYLFLCLVSAGEVVVACDQMHYALAYLSGYRARQTPSGERITRADHIAYQLENLFLRMHMIPDRCLKLTNNMFRLGVLPRECRSRVIADNEYVRRTSVRARLRSINKIVEPYREVRNAIAHLERYSDSGLSEIEGYFILEKSSHFIDDPLVERYRQLYKTEADRYIDARRAELGAVVDALVAAVAKFFDALLPVFGENYKKLAEVRPTSEST